MENNREFERFELELTARLGIEEAGPGQEKIALITSNICAGGAFFITNRPLPLGTRVKMELALSIDKLKKLLDSECRIEVLGEVVRSEGRGIAIRFDRGYRIIPLKPRLN